MPRAHDAAASRLAPCGDCQTHDVARFLSSGRIVASSCSARTRIGAADRGVPRGVPGDHIRALRCSAARRPTAAAHHDRRDHALPMRDCAVEVPIATPTMPRLTVRAGLPTT